MKTYKCELLGVNFISAVLAPVDNSNYIYPKITIESNKDLAIFLLHPIKDRIEIFRALVDLNMMYICPKDSKPIIGEFRYFLTTGIYDLLVRIR